MISYKSVLICSLVISALCDDFVPAPETMSTIQTDSISVSQTNGDSVTYTATYNTFYQDEANYFNVTLNLANVDTSAVTTTDGTDGIWVGLGFNSATMYPANVILCTFLYNGDTTDATS